MPNPLNLTDVPDLKDKAIKKVQVKSVKKYPVKPKKRKLSTDTGHMIA